jgi:uncharacterized protein YbjT (DUF2867 family)
MKILVTGATGRIGRRVVDELLALGADDVRALTVDPARAALPAGVEVVTGYLGRVETLPAAFEGVDLMYLAPLLSTVDEVTRLAARAGVRHIVDLAGGEGSQWPPIKAAVEASGVPWTHLDAGEFMSNVTLWAGQIRAGDQVRDAYPDSANTLIAPEDIAAVAARILVDGGHEGRTYVLTGPETLTRAEKVRQIGLALGRELTYVEISPEEAVERLRPTLGDFAQWYVAGLARTTENRRPSTGDVVEILGRPGMTLGRWVTDHVDLFA